MRSRYPCPGISRVWGRFLNASNDDVKKFIFHHFQPYGNKTAAAGSNNTVNRSLSTDDKCSLKKKAMLAAFSSESFTGSAVHSSVPGYVLSLHALHKKYEKKRVVFFWKFSAIHNRVQPPVHRSFSVGKFLEKNLSLWAEESVTPCLRKRIEAVSMLFHPYSAVGNKTSLHSIQAPPGYRSLLEWLPISF